MLIAPNEKYWTIDVGNTKGTNNLLCRRKKVEEGSDIDRKQKRDSLNDKRKKRMDGKENK